MDNNRHAERSHLSSFLTLLLLLVVLGFILVWRFWPHMSAGVDNNYVMRQIEPRGSLADFEKTTIDIYNKASPAVVHITTLRNSRDFFNLNVQQIPEGTGSGIVWDKKGYIVTNFHVIRNADAAQVTLADRTTWDGKVVGGYPDKDLAVLSIAAPAERLFPISVGKSANLQVGQSAFAIGNPFGLDRTYSKGIVSAIGREIQSVTDRPIKEVIQTDAAINPGNSGGPLLDSAGLLIGVNTSILSPSGAFSGIGFAIPVDEVNRAVTQIIRHGKVTRPKLGVEMASDQLMKELGVTGALVVNVLPDSPAEKAGLKPTRRNADGKLELGDIITAVDDHVVKSVNDLFDAMDNYKTGDTITLTVERQGKQEKVPVTLKASAK